MATSSSTDQPHQAPPQPSQQPRSGQMAPPKRGTQTTATRELDPNKDGFATVRDNADYADDPEKPFEPQNTGMEAKDWPRGPSDVKVKGDEGVIDSSIRGYGLKGGQRAQPDQSGYDPDAPVTNPGYDMLKAGEEAEKKRAAAAKG